MKRARLLLNGLLAAGIGTIAFAECLPTIQTAFNLNGIIVGGLFGGGGAPPGSCLPDPGWGGVTAGTFAPVGGVPDTHVSRMFFVGQATGNTVDKIYVGIHVENDDGFSDADIVTLYFDADNSGGAFNSADFALRIEMGPTTVPTTEECLKPVASNKITFYTFSGGTWTVQPMPPAGITASTAWDYEAKMTDPEKGIWEMELQIEPTTIGKPITVSQGLKIGAKLYIDEPGNGKRVLAFPAGLTTDEDPNATSPNDGAVTTAKLSTLTVGTGTCEFDVEIVSILGEDRNGNAGKFTRFPGTISATLSEAQTNKFSAQVRFKNKGNAGDTSAVAVPNAGTVTFRLFPYSNTAGSFTGEFLAGTATVAFTQVGQTKSVPVMPPKVIWPRTEADYSPARSKLAAADHVCMKVSLGGFAVNQDLTTDTQSANLYFSSLSTVRDSFLIEAPQKEGPGALTRFAVRARWHNLPDVLVNTTPARPRRGLWNYRFTNAARIGLKDMGNGWYSIDLKPGQSERVEVELTGGDMPSSISSREYKLSPRAGGLAAQPPSGERPLAVGVKPGMMVTVVANGLINVDPRRKRPNNGPNGFADPEMARQPFLIGERSAYAGAENIGALIGSFDDFKTSFVIGGASSFMVPENRSRLSLAVNDVAGQYADNSGRGFSLTVILTDPMFLPTRIASPGNPGNGLPVIGPIGMNMPRLNIDVLQVDEQRRGLRPAGYVAYAITNSHR